VRRSGHASPPLALLPRFELPQRTRWQLGDVSNFAGIGQHNNGKWPYQTKSRSAGGAGAHRPVGNLPSSMSGSGRADVSSCSSFLPRRALKTAVLPETALVDISVWVGLGIVGLRAALDVFAENVPSAMEVGTPRGHRRSELGRIRRLPSSLCSQRRGRDRCRMRAQLRSHRLSLDLGDLRYYASTAQSVLGYFSVM